MLEVSNVISPGTSDAVLVLVGIRVPFGELAIGEKFNLPRPSGCRGQSPTYEKIELGSYEGIEGGNYNTETEDGRKVFFFDSMMCIRV